MVAQRGCSRLDRDHLQHQAMPYANKEAQRAAARRHYEANREAYIAKSREQYQRKRESGEYAQWLEQSREARAEYKRQQRRKNGAQAQEQRALNKALRAKPSPSVARLVAMEQRRYWKENPSARAAYYRQWTRVIWSWRYMVDPEFRRHECQRNSEKKARNRGNHTVRLRPGALGERFAFFGNTCCYCGSDDRIVVDHFIPRAKGGPHTIGNLLPACHRCNTSKRDHDPESWYKAQSFYSLTRWRLILKVLDKKSNAVGQLPLL